MQIFLQRLRKLMTQWRTGPVEPTPLPAKKTRQPRAPKNAKTTIS